jgi:hypothetical protein
MSVATGGLIFCFVVSTEFPQAPQDLSQPQAFQVSDSDDDDDVFHLLCSISCMLMCGPVVAADCA